MFVISLDSRYSPGDLIQFLLIELFLVIVTVNLNKTTCLILCCSAENEFESDRFYEKVDFNLFHCRLVFDDFGKL